MSKQTVEKPLWWNGRWCRFFLFQVFNVQCLFKRIFGIAGQCQKPYKNLQSICGTKRRFLIFLLLYLLARCDFITQAMLRVLLLFVAVHGEFLSPLQRAIRQGDASSVKHLLAENEENDQGYSYDDELGFLSGRSIFWRFWNMLLTVLGKLTVRQRFRFQNDSKTNNMPQLPWTWYILRRKITDSVCRKS